MKKSIQPKAGETWMTEKGAKAGPLMLDDDGDLYTKDGLWAPSGKPRLHDGYTANKLGALVKPYTKATPTNFQRVAARMAKAKSITEARAIYTKAIKRGRK